MFKISSIVNIFQETETSPRSFRFVAVMLKRKVFPTILNESCGKQVIDKERFMRLHNLSA